MSNKLQCTKNQPRCNVTAIGVRERILMGGRKKFALKIQFALKIDNLS